jgi:hypothetical protein
MFLTFQQVSKFCQFFSIFLSIFQLPLRRSNHGSNIVKLNL